VGEHSREEVARRVGVDTDYLDRLVELAILKPGSRDAFSLVCERRAGYRAWSGPACPWTGMEATEEVDG
jgi:hypothetical protein